ncbi:hypothetical protein EYF80_036045 [Liparis tanakae]|uniref:Uncharacterized protein n=1 Tax=Liparis tanakae TaxID=230148 RepID=A0A4Z2GJS1_9TELE|nr:hypothetical protein EYF80_036045 [Liparis tanakae]
MNPEETEEPMLTKRPRVTGSRNKCKRREEGKRRREEGRKEEREEGLRKKKRGRTGFSFINSHSVLVCVVMCDRTCQHAVVLSPLPVIKAL